MQGDAATPPGDSLRAGWLRPAPGPEAQVEEDALQALVCGLTGLPGPLARPRWQPNPPKVPGPEINWCAFGVINGGAPGGTAWHEDGETRLEVHERLIVMFSFYGPGACGNAKALRNGLFIEQNRAMLRSLANMAFVNAGDIIPAPELVGGKWIRRQDIQITLTRGPEMVDEKPGDEGRTDIKDLDSVQACGLCGRSR